MRDNATSKEAPPVYDPSAPVVMNAEQVQKILPHRPPFLFVDKIVEVTDEYATGVKQVSISEPILQGHFPGYALLPGVIQMEALAQVGMIYVNERIVKLDEHWVYLVAARDFRFKRPVVPGDTLVMRSRLSHPMKRGMVTTEAHMFVNDQVVCHGSIVANIQKK